MKFVNKIVITLFVLLSVQLYGQTSQKLKGEQKKLEQKISNTKLLLKKTKSNVASSLNELQVIENQIRYREQLLKNYDNQIRSGELKVKQKEQDIESLQEKLHNLKKQYRKMLIYAYKKRSKYGRLMYLFSSGSYNEARKRTRFLGKMAELQQKQFLIIQQNQQLIKKEIGGIQKEKEYKLSIIDEKRVEKDAILNDRLKKEEIYEQLKAQEGELLASLKEEEKKKAILKERINEAIRKEIAETEAKKKKEAEAAKKKAEATKKPSNPEKSVSEKTTTTETSTTAASKETTTVSFTETKESAELGANFENNQGKLPWPVDKGNITENFGKNPHPTLKDVYTNNRGIDISTPKNAQVRAVFDGEVTSVLNIPGAGKVIIIKHGNYRTVYSNLQETYVKAGMKVNTKKVIGSLLVTGNQNLSVLHFEIHKVEGGNVVCLNPGLWVSR